MQEVVIVGGLEMQQQAKALARRPHVVVATPGRLKVCVHAIPMLPAQNSPTMPPDSLLQFDQGDSGVCLSALAVLISV